jgi:hypothetical protein
MPTKTTKDGQRYRVTAKDFTWTSDEGTEVTIPLRIKLKVIRQLADQDPDNVAVMFAILEQLIPHQGEALDEMDVNDFTAMFSAWQDEYTKLGGATPGESSPSTV